MNQIKLKGKIISGVLRGKRTIKAYSPRIINLLGFKPFEGTLNLKIEKPIDIRRFATKKISRILMNGSERIEAYLAPAVLCFKKKYNCWVIRQTNNVHKDDIIEIIAKDNLKEKFSLKEGNEVEVMLFEHEIKKRDPFKLIKQLYGRERQLKKS